MKQTFINAIAGTAKIGGVRATEFCRYDFITFDQAEFAGSVLVQLEDSLGPNSLVLDVFCTTVGPRGRKQFQIFQVTVSAVLLEQEGLLGLLLRSIRGATQNPVALNEVGLQRHLAERKVGGKTVEKWTFSQLWSDTQRAASLPR